MPINNYIFASNHKSYYRPNIESVMVLQSKINKNQTKGNVIRKMSLNYGIVGKKVCKTKFSRKCNINSGI